MLNALCTFPGERYVRKNLEFSVNGDLEPVERFRILDFLSEQATYAKVKTGAKVKPDILSWVKKNESFYRDAIPEFWFNRLPDVITDKGDLANFNKLFPEEGRSKMMQIRYIKNESVARRNEILFELYKVDVIKYLESYNNQSQNTKNN